MKEEELEKWEEDYKRTWKWTSLGIVLLILAIYSGDTNASLRDGQYSFPVKTVELHIIKNDGMNTHEVFLCRDARTCYDLYLSKWFKDRVTNCATQMYMVRNGRTILKLKSDNTIKK